MKKFLATLFLSGDKAIKSIGNREIVSDDPVKYAKRLIDHNIDALYILELSKSDVEHEVAVSVIEQIVSVSDIPVYVAGNIKTIFDVEKFIEMGCGKVILNMGKESNIAILCRFQEMGFRDNLGVAITGPEQLTIYEELIRNTSSEIVVMRESALKDCLLSNLNNFVVPAADIPLDRLMDILDKDKVSGIFGTFVNYNLNSLNSVKSLCRERGIEVNAFSPLMTWADMKKNDIGLVPVVVQDYENNEVLMVAYMDENAFNKTVNTGIMTYYSRSRSSEWVKGETSGHFQFVKSLYADCDSDTILAKVSQVGAACHTGKRSCFFKEIIKRRTLDII